MIGKVTAYNDNDVIIELTGEKSDNLINNHVVFDYNNIRIVGEITKLTVNDAVVNLLGEIINNKFIPGVNKKPKLDASARLINTEELAVILNYGNNFSFILGTVPLYNNVPITVNFNDFFSKHFAILGSTGSGKSFAMSSIIQSIFKSSTTPINSKIYLFDVYGEYYNALANINTYNSNLRFKNITTNIGDKNNLLRIPLWLLGVDDIALLLNATSAVQLPIIETSLKLVNIFAKKDDSVNKIKNNIIAKAIIEILYSGKNPMQIRDQIFAILTAFNTKDLNLETPVVVPGWTRPLRQCLLIDKDGKINEIKLVTDFISSFIDDSIVLTMPDENTMYTLADLKEAMDFSLIQEGMFVNNKIYEYASVLSIRLQNIINSDKKYYFEFDRLINKKDYLESIGKIEGINAQIINLNINYFDDRFAKVIVKILSKLIFENSCDTEPRASRPVHIFLEEAHRYVQNDTDTQIIGYNIFDRITKEGRKYGCLIGLISQRPSELSETAISQCANFIVLKMSHPKDLEFIKNMAPNITNEIMNRLKVLQPGFCMAFGTAFKIPLTIYLELPNPTPYSDNTDLTKTWI